MTNETQDPEDTAAPEDAEAEDTPVSEEPPEDPAKIPEWIANRTAELGQASAGLDLNSQEFLDWQINITSLDFQRTCDPRTGAWLVQQTKQALYLDLQDKSHLERARMAFVRAQAQDRKEVETHYIDPTPERYPILFTKIKKDSKNLRLWFLPHNVTPGDPAMRVGFVDPQEIT